MAPKDPGVPHYDWSEGSKSLVNKYPAEIFFGAIFLIGILLLFAQCFHI
jgi:hypothetical protein